MKKKKKTKKKKDDLAVDEDDENNWKCFACRKLCDCINCVKTTVSVKALLSHPISQPAPGGNSNALKESSSSVAAPATAAPAAERPITKIKFKRGSLEKITLGGSTGDKNNTKGNYVHNGMIKVKKEIVESSCGSVGVVVDNAIEAASTNVNDADSVVEELYEVEALLKKQLVKMNNGRNCWYWKVKWKGYPMEESTWEPEGNLLCPQLMQIHTYEVNTTAIPLADLWAKKL